MRRAEIPPDSASAQPNAGRWRPGQSGNPTGRKAGSRNRATLALDALGQGDAAGIVRVVIREALGGNLVAAGLILQRVWPVRRGAPIRLDLPPVRTAADLPAAIAAITTAVANGVLSPEEGASVTTILEAQRRAVETSDLEQRIAELEKYHAQK